MKLVTFENNGVDRVGAVSADGRSIVDLEAAAEMTGIDGSFGSMIEFLEAGAAGLRTAGSLLDSPDSRNLLRLDAARLRAPVPCPRKLFALAGNYVEHITEAGRAVEPQDKQTPRVFMKPPFSTVIGPGADILIPPIARSIDWEGELAVVIGKAAKGVSRQEALDYVAGYTIMNDVSERDLKIWDRSDSRPQDKWFDWLNGKWLDTFAPQGPWIVTCDEIPDPQTLEISTYVNGERKQHSNTSQMIFPVASIIEYISAFVRLDPGDIITTGTVAGVGAASSTFLSPGDQVKIAISQIGELCNGVAASDK